jgi:hypothetical protein
LRDYHSFNRVNNLVLVIWNLNSAGPTLLFVFSLLEFDMRLTWSS